MTRPRGSPDEGDAERHWRGGWLAVYVNKDDPRLWVPKKRPGIGWTLNLGHPKAKPVIAVLVALGAAAITMAMVIDA